MPQFNRIAQQLQDRFVLELDRRHLAALAFRLTNPDTPAVDQAAEDAAICALAELAHAAHPGVMH